MATTRYIKTDFTGGAASDLDSIDGDNLLDGDEAHVYNGGIVYHYVLDDDSGDAEDSPYIIAPNDNAGDKRWILQSGDSVRIKWDQNVETLADNKTLTITDYPVQKLDPGGSDRNVTLPAEASSTDLVFVIFNTSDGGGEDLTVKNDGATTIGVLVPGEVGLFSCDGTDWLGGKMIPPDGPVYVDSINDRVGVGIQAPDNHLHVYDSGAAPGKFEHNTTSTAGGVSVLKLNAKSTGNMASGFGGSVSFTIEDDAGATENEIGYIGARRGNADTEGELVFLAGTDGAEEFLRIRQDGKIDVPNIIESRYQGGDEFDQEATGVQLAAGLNKDFWTPGGTNYAAANLTYQNGISSSGLRFVTAGGDDDSVFIAGLPIFKSANNPWIEAVFYIADISNAHVAIGFVEGSYVDKAAPDDDVCVIGFDSDNGHTKGADQLLLYTNNDGAGVNVDDLGVQIAASTAVKIRIDLTDLDQPRVWIDDTEIAAGSIAGTVQSGIYFMPYIMVQSLSGAADTLSVKNIKWGQAR